jgi:uncharacterized protein YkwD
MRFQTIAAFFILFNNAARVQAQLIHETSNQVPAEYKTTFAPGRYVATVHSGTFRPALELLDASGNVLIVKQSTSQRLPASTELRFFVNQGGTYTLRVRSPENDGRFHLLLTHAATPVPAVSELAPREKTGLTTREQQVVDQVNQERAKAGLQPLRVSPRLTEAARRHSTNMARQSTGAHELDGVGPGERIRETGYRAMQWGENIAWGARTPEQAMSGWMNSPGHRRNILSSDVNEIGVGVADGSDGVPYWTQVFGRPWE